MTVHLSKELWEPGDKPNDEVIDTMARTVLRNSGDGKYVPEEAAILSDADNVVMIVAGLLDTLEETQPVLEDAAVRTALVGATSEHKQILDTMVRKVMARVRELEQPAVPSVVIEVCERAGDFYTRVEWVDEATGYREIQRPRFRALIRGTTGQWSAGDNRDEAVGNLVRCHPELFGVEIEQLGKLER